MPQIKVEHNLNDIQGLAVITPTIHGDSRGYFMETYNTNEMKDAGLNMVFIQDNQSCSAKGVLRGLHYQKQYPQGKLVRVISGAVFDVAVDLRRSSPTYAKSFGVILDDKLNQQLYIPRGFAHGFLVLTDIAVFAYKVTDFWHPNDEGGLAWNDIDIKVDWPLDKLNGADIILSDKDKKNASLKELERQGLDFADDIKKPDSE